MRGAKETLRKEHSSNNNKAKDYDIRSRRGTCKSSTSYL
nr:MAG TPA: hypothetical protein [Caudoviricetes sp.]